MARLASAIARMRSAMLQGDAAGEQEQYQRREALTDRMQRVATQQALFAQQNQAREDAQAARREQQVAEQDYRNRALEQQGNLTREQVAAANQRAADQRALEERLAKAAADLRRELTPPRGGAGGGAGGAGVGGPGLPPADVSKETTLRKEFSQHMSGHDQIAAGLSKIRESVKLGSGAGDMGIIFGFMRMQDPNSTVREGEYATAQNTSGVPDWVRTQYNKALDGEQLSAGQRANFLQAAEALGNDQRRMARQTAERYAQIASQYGMPSERVVYDPYSSVMGSDLGNPSGKPGGAAAKIKRALGGQP